MSGSNSRFADFEPQAFISEIRAIVSGRTGVAGQSIHDLVLAVMQAEFEMPERIAEALPEYEKDDVILFEDATVSIWFCRFKPGLQVPPHDHQMNAFIGVYSGVELNSFYERSVTTLNKTHESRIGAGDVLSIAPDDIHSVTTAGPDPSRALHVYLGELTKVERSLFEWETGKSVAFTQDNYERMVRQI